MLETINDSSEFINKNLFICLKYVASSFLFLWCYPHVNDKKQEYLFFFFLVLVVAPRSATVHQGGNNASRAHAYSATPSTANRLNPTSSCVHFSGLLPSQLVSWLFPSLHLLATDASHLGTDAKYPPISNISLVFRTNWASEVVIKIWIIR